MIVAVFGLGYVGCVSAACLAKLGHTVYGVDPDAYKVDCLNRGQAPFHEPGLDELLADAIAQGRLKASTSAGSILMDCQVALLCVGTPSASDGSLDLTFLRRVCGEIAAAPRPESLIVSIRSTVFPGASEMLHGEIFGFDPSIQMVSNPEFLREGSAVADFLEPSLIVVGGSHSDSVDSVAAIYASLTCPVEKVSIRTAEMIKYACNAFHAVKIAFANEIGSLCRHNGIDGGEVMRVLCEDRKLNVSPAYLRPGFAFGGSCLPKDLRALTAKARGAGIQLPLLENVLPSNREHLTRLNAWTVQLPASRLGIFGLAFKENTDDLRDSPVIEFVEELLAKGRSLRIFDPHIDLGKIYGANQRFLLDRLPHISRLMVPSLEDWLAWPEALVLAQKPSPRLRAALEASGKPILDLTL